MATHYSAIITALDTIIGNVTGVKEHYTYEPQQFTKYPAVTILPLGHTEKYLSLRDTQRDYKFVIRVWGQMDNTRTDTQITVRDLADAIIDAVGTQANIQLGGIIDWSMLTDATFKFMQTTSSLYVAEMTYTARQHYSRV